MFRHILCVRVFTVFSFIAVSALSFAQGTSATKHQVLADGHPIAVWEKSVTNPKGHILLHHGRTWSSIPDFDLQVPGEDLSLMDGFNKMGYSAWAMDARGYGGTPRDDSQWNTPQRAANDMAIVLDWLQNRNDAKTNVWGWSYGSMVAQLTAQLYPEAIRTVTLFGYPTDPDAEVAVDTSNASIENRVNTAEAAASDFIVPGSISDEAIAGFVDASLASDPIRADWNQLHQWNALDGEALTLPTLLLQAEFDPLADTDAHARFFSKIANANKQWIVLAGGDHAALIETPRLRLIEATIDFIEWVGL